MARGRRAGAGAAGAAGLGAGDDPAGLSDQYLGHAHLLTRPLGPPAASLTFGATSAAMPSFANTPMTWAAVTPPPAGAVWAMDFAASSARLSASGDDTSGL